MVKTYKITITFEMLDEDKEIESEIIRHGIDFMEDVFATGFNDPDFRDVKCTIEDKS